MNILLVMDDETIAENFALAWKSMGLASDLNYVSDPGEVRAFLEQDGHSVGWARPDIVIVPSGLSPQSARELYCLDAGCFISTPADLGEYFRFMERESKLSVRMILLPRGGALSREVRAVS